MKTRILFLLIIVAVFCAMNGVSQPRPVSILEPGSGFTSIGGYVYFSIFPNLYRTDGTFEGTIELANAPRARNYFEFKNEVYFLADGPRETTELWKTDGTPGGTVPVAAFFSISIMNQTADYIFFAASLDETGLELYRTNGQPGGTILLKDIQPGAGDGLSTISNPSAVLGDKLIFVADNGVAGRELWKSDGTPSGTTMMRDVNPGADDGYAGGNIASFQGHVYFSGKDPLRGAELWRTDGTNAGTIFFRGLVPGAEGSQLYFTPEHNGLMYFSSAFFDGLGVKTDLWRTDGASATKVKSLCYECRFEPKFVDFKNKLYFVMYEDYGTHSVWGTNGTSTGTNRVFSKFLDGAVPFFDRAGDYLFFYTMGQEHALDLYRSDGTAATVIWRFRSGGLMMPVDMESVGDRVYFADHAGPADYGGYAIDPDDHLQLFQTDGDSVIAVRDVFDISFANTANITDYEGKVFFTTTNEDGMTLWLYDPNEVEPSASFTVVNADTDEDIQTLHDGDTLVKPADLNINIRYNPLGTPGSVLFKHQGRSVRRESQPPFSVGGDNNGNYLTWAAATPGQHTLEAIPYHPITGEAGLPLFIHFTIQSGTSACAASGTIAREFWTGVSGTSVSYIPTDTPPDGIEQLTLFEGPTNAGTNYGARIRGYICPPVSGEYRFWIASNDHSELWLSADDDPANKSRIAYTDRATGPREWNRFATQASAAIWLTQGQTYYIEALHKQGIGGDHVAVGWQLPDGTMERPIAGTRLSPFAVSDDATARLRSDGMFEQISVYPNPANANDRELTISGFEGIEHAIETDVQIINLSGDIVFSEKVRCGGDCGSYLLTINKQLAPGLYLVNMTSKGTTHTRRLLVR